jgi:hypothetical protein
VTARDGAVRVALEVFPESEAIRLPRITTDGYRAGDDEHELVELAGLCARLPLALRIAAERAAARPKMPLAELIQDLRGESLLWDALSAEDGTQPASFSRQTRNTFPMKTTSSAREPAANPTVRPNAARFV